MFRRFGTYEFIWRSVAKLPSINFAVRVTSPDALLSKSLASEVIQLLVEANPWKMHSASTFALWKWLSIRFAWWKSFKKKKYFQQLLIFYSCKIFHSYVKIHEKFNSKQASFGIEVSLSTELSGSNCFGFSLCISGWDFQYNAQWLHCRARIAHNHCLLPLVNNLSL